MTRKTLAPTLPRALILGAAACIAAPSAAQQMQLPIPNNRTASMATPVTQQTPPPAAFPGNPGFGGQQQQGVPVFGAQPAPFLQQNQGVAMQPAPLMQQNQGAAVLPAQMAPQMPGVATQPAPAMQQNQIPLIPGFGGNAAQGNQAPAPFGAPMSQPAAAAGTAPAQDTAAGEPAAPVPFIQLSPAPSEDGGEPLQNERAVGGWGPSSPADEADTGLPVREDWTVPLVPAGGRLPSTIAVGASMGQPGIVRLTGESVEHEFFLDVPFTDRTPNELVLSMRSSVNVLPENSVLTVSINGGEPMSMPLDAIGPFEDLRIRTAALMPGSNSIRVHVKQMHRIFCGPDATFSTWTEIDTANSGVRVRPEEVPLTGDGFLAAIRAQAALTGSINLLTDGNDHHDIVRALSGNLGYAIGWPPEIEIGSFYEVNASEASRARIAISESTRDAITFHRGAGGGIVMLAEHLPGNVPDFGSILPDRPMQPTMHKVELDTPTTFAELGKPLIIGNSNYYRADIDFALPEDWLLLASQKAYINLIYGYSDTLTEDSLLLVKVNDETVQMLPLDVDGGGIKPELEITFWANYLRSGANRLSFEMIVPGDPEDMQCVTRATDMLAILGESSIEVPSSPKMRREDMGVALNRIGPDSVVIPGPARRDPDDDAALLMPLAMSFAPLSTDGQARLNVITPEYVDAIPSGEVALKRRLLQRVLTPETARIDRPGIRPAEQAPVVAPGGSTLGGYRLSLSEAAAQPAVATEEEDAKVSFASFVNVPRLIESGQEQLDQMLAMLTPEDPQVNRWLSRRQGDAVLLQLDPKDPNNLWLVVRPGADLPSIGLRIDEFRRSAQTKGNLAVLKSDGTWDVWAASWYPEMREPMVAQNIRPVLGNYASWSPVTFTILTLLLALVSAIPALIYVVSTRRKGSRT